MRNARRRQSTTCTEQAGKTPEITGLIPKSTYAGQPAYEDYLQQFRAEFAACSEVALNAAAFAALEESHRRLAEREIRGAA